MVAIRAIKSLIVSNPGADPRIVGMIDPHSIKQHARMISTTIWIPGIFLTRLSKLSISVLSVNHAPQPEGEVSSMVVAALARAEALPRPSVRRAGRVSRIPCKHRWATLVLRLSTGKSAAVEKAVVVILVVENGGAEWAIMLWRVRISSFVSFLDFGV
jgi:hypothetical protein